MTSSTSTNHITFVSPRRRIKGQLLVALAALSFFVTLTIGRDNDPWMVQIVQPSLTDPYGYQLPLLMTLLMAVAFGCGIWGMYVHSTSGHQPGRHRR